MRRNLTLILFVGSFLAIAYAGFAIAVTALPSNLIAKFDGGVIPMSLPKHEMAPAALRVYGEISTLDGSQPPALRKVIVDLDKNGMINARGLPVCRREQLAGRSIQSAERACEEAIVGTGTAHIETTNSKQLLVTLTIFNGGADRGTITILIHIANNTSALAVAVVKVRKVYRGRYGLEAISKIPAILNGGGSVLDFSFNLKRRFYYKGSKHGYIMARCPDHRLYAHVRASFEDRSIVEGTVVRSCAAK